MRDLIEKTEAFLNLDPVKQIIYKRREKMREVEHQYNLSKHLGFEKWKQQYKPDSYTENVVKELLQTVHDSQ